MNIVKIVIAGPRGKMGSEAVKLVQETEGYELVAVLDHKNDGGMLSEFPGFSGLDIPVFADISACLKASEPDVLIDLTTPEVGMHHTKNRFAIWRSPCCWDNWLYKGKFKGA